MVTIDSHCHAWRKWPYQPPVPDFESRGIVEQLLFEMDAAGVDRAAIVCARIAHNPDDNDYVAECVRRFPERLYQIADVDCSWTETYHTPGAADRLRETADRYGCVGFTHYVKRDDDGAWFLSDDGLAFFRAAEERRLIASISCASHQLAVLRQVAERFPAMPILIHHMGHPKAVEPPPYPQFQEIIRSAALPNVYIKLSGFHYASPVAWEYPFSDCAWLVRGLYEHFGPDRLCWGSDYPVVAMRQVSYRQALEVVRTHCDFIPPEHKARILGDNLYRLIGERQA
jgi:predicted TIM-barrel fold metal-dependent hydrolase